MRVFVQTNDRQLLAAKVAAHAVRTSSPTVEVSLLELRSAPALIQREGEQYLRNGEPATWRNDDLQSFTPLRFRPPELMGYTGRALVIDPDVFALADVRPLLQRDLGACAIACRRISPMDGRAPYWASSVMALDCARLKHWRWEEMIEAMFGFDLDYRHLMSLDLEDPASIMELEEEWNHFDTLDTTTKLLHNTSRITQPWKTGLPIDFTKDSVPDPPTFRSRVRGAARRVVRGPQAPLSYRAHPDLAQERLFFRLLAKAIGDGAVEESAVRTEIESGHLRRDGMELLEAARRSA